MNSNKTVNIQIYITQTPVLWFFGILYLVTTIAFAVVMNIWEFHLIDEMFVKEDILAHVESMSAEQRRVHAITTLTLDVVYPFAYGVFQAGMAYRFLGHWGKWIAPLSLFCMPVDLIEGFSQVMILNGSLEFVELKSMVTPLKLVLFIPGLIGAIVALGIAIKRTRAK